MSKKSCFIFDEDAGHTATLARVCEAAGFTVNSCSSVATAKTLLANASTPVDVAFVSLNAQAGDSLALLATAALGHAEIMVMTEIHMPTRVRAAMDQGASYCLSKPFDPRFLTPILCDIAANIVADDHAASGAQALRSIDQFGCLRGSSPPMRELYRTLRKVASTNASLFIIGESGTGKELVARTAHSLSDRKGGPFMAVNCAAIAETLIESELFGHEKGSFSGADKRHLGLFECAAGGTLLLDEITEMNPDLQAKLLRVLETRKVRRVGSEQDIDIDVRVISTTNRMPEEAVAAGKLREDLYYRLAQVPVSMPPLRLRGGDVCGLAHYFLSELNSLHGSSSKLDQQALHALSAYHWPGNVRQLRHAIERAYILSGSTIGTEFLPQDEPNINRFRRAGEMLEVCLDDSLEESERRIVLAMLKRNNGDKSATAKTLGISLKTLYNRLSAYNTAAAPHVALVS